MFSLSHGTVQCAQQDARGREQRSVCIPSHFSISLSFFFIHYINLSALDAIWFVFPRLFFSISVDPVITKKTNKKSFLPFLYFVFFFKSNCLISCWFLRGHVSVGDPCLLLLLLCSVSRTRLSFVQ